MTRNIDVGLLRAFVAVVETGSVTRAAHLLNLTQAAVSQQLKRLEELLGVELFDRTNRALRTSADGERLLPHAHAMLSQRHEVLAVRLWDPREVELPDVGPIIMQDAETGEQLYVDTSDRRFRERYQAAMREREEQLGTSFRRAGVAQLPLATDEDLVRAIVRFAALRRSERR